MMRQTDWKRISAFVKSILLGLIVCSIICFIVMQILDNKKNMTKADKFIWNIQWAGYDFDKTDQKGEIHCTAFIKEFEAFPWMEQIEKANRNEDKSSPTISVQDLKTGKDFWISMSGDRNEYGYIIGYIYPKEKKTFFGLGKSKTVRWCEMYLTEETPIVKELITLFFDRNYMAFESRIRSLKMFDEMESLDLAYRP